MTLVSEVTAKVRRVAPDSTVRWTDSHVQSLVHAADCEIKDRCETRWASYDITLLDDTHYYNLPEDVIFVRSVTFSRDGTNFDDGLLKAITYRRLDKLSRTWKDDRGTEPEHFLVLSTPGVNTISKIMIWRPLSSVASEKIRVNYLSCYPTESASFTASTAPEWVQDAVYVPYVLAHLYATSDTQLASAYAEQYERKVNMVRTRFDQPYGEGLGGFRSGGSIIGGRQL